MRKLAFLVTQTVDNSFVDDFDGDHIADVVRWTGFEWDISSGGTAPYALLRPADAQAFTPGVVGHFDVGAKADSVFWRQTGIARNDLFIAPGGKSPTHALSPFWMQ